MVVTKDRPHGPGRSVLMFIIVKCEDHSAIQAPQISLEIPGFESWNEENIFVQNEGFEQSKRSKLREDKNWSLV